MRPRFIRSSTSRHTPVTRPFVHSCLSTVRRNHESGNPQILHRTYLSHVSSRSRRPSPAGSDRIPPAGRTIAGEHARRHQSRSSHRLRPSHRHRRRRNPRRPIRRSGAPPRIDARHQSHRHPRPPSQRQRHLRRPLRRLRVGPPHLRPRLQPEPARLHPRRRAARRHVLRQPQRPPHQPRPHRRKPRTRRPLPGHRRARHRLHQQPRRSHPVPLHRPLRQAQLHRAAVLRQLQRLAYLRPLRYRPPPHPHQALRRRRLPDLRQVARRRPPPPKLLPVQHQAGAVRRQEGRLHGVRRLLQPPGSRLPGRKLRLGPAARL